MVGHNSHDCGYNWKVGSGTAVQKLGNKKRGLKYTMRARLWSVGLFRQRSNSKGKAGLRKLRFESSNLLHHYGNHSGNGVHEGVDHTRRILLSNVM